MFNTTDVGMYEFIFTNSHIFDDETVTLALHCGKSK